MAKKISILGSTGSIGQNTINVIRHLNGDFQIHYLTASKNASLLIEQALEWHPKSVAILDEDAAKEVAKAISSKGIEILAGRSGLLEIASRGDVDLVVNALVGGSGMEPTLRALESGVDVALSNKESMVVAGQLVQEIRSRTGAKIFPIDSEHSAIWQCLEGEKKEKIRKIILTGSGGPFRERSLDEFSTITVEEALRHPNWEMGKKITIDSATMMNKGLEIIEAFWLFGVRPEQIEVVIHPQSIIHSMVEFVDGSIKAQVGLPDMRLPIQYALTYPDRKDANWFTTSFPDIRMLTFEKPDLNRFPCISLAFNALEKGGTACAALNHANDQSVQIFLDHKIPFTKISQINETVLVNHPWVKSPDLHYLSELELWIQSYIKSIL